MPKIKKKSLKDYRHGDLKVSLIKAALGSIAKSGEVEFSLRDLAQRAGVTHAAAYRHFSSKKDILAAIAEQGHVQLSESFRKVLRANPEDLEGLGVAYVEFAIKNPYHFKVMFHPDVKAREGNGLQTSAEYDAFGHLLESVEANKKGGQFLDQDAHLIAMSAWAGVHGLATLIVNAGLEKKMKMDSISMTRTLAGHLMRGFLKRN